MQIQEFNTDKAEGVILIHPIYIDDRSLSRGHQLNQNDLVFLKSVGISHICGIKLQPGDISADNALNSLAEKICGHNLSYTTPENGSCKIVAAGNGVFIASDERIAKFNRMSNLVILNTVQPYKNIKKGEVIAQLTISTPIIEKELIKDMLIRLSGNDALLGISSKLTTDAAVIYTRLQNDEEENIHFTAVTRKLIKNLAELGINLVEEYNISHDVENIADTIQSALRFYPLVFVLPATSTVHNQDTLPTALNRLVDDIICENIPQNNCSDLLIATKRNSKIIGIPYNYDSISSPLVDRFIKMAITKEALSQADFAHPEMPTLAKTELSEAEKAGLVANRNSRSREKYIAAVILAAGTATRARCNKLMVEVDGKPLFMKTVEAALKSKASPIFVVTGYQAEKIEKCLENIDVNVLHNYEYSSGVKTSIRIGLRSVPSYCDGAILIPADMPNITPEHLDNMIDAFRLDESRQILATSDGKDKCNPVLWSRELYAEAELVPENADVREIFIEHADYTKYIRADKELCLDVNFPYDVEVILKSC